MVWNKTKMFQKENLSKYYQVRSNFEDLDLNNTMVQSKINLPNSSANSRFFCLNACLHEVRYVCVRLLRWAVPLCRLHGGDQAFRLLRWAFCDIATSSHARDCDDLRGGGRSRRIPDFFFERERYSRILSATADSD
jgi:hypothetical protein